MKRLLIFSITFLLLLQVRSIAQNVGINDDGSTPNNSAMLDVKSNSKGLLIPQIALTGVNDASTITTPATSLLVYNTTDGSGLTPGYYYNSGTPASPVWKALISAGGLTNFTESNYSYDSKYGVKLLARNDAQTNVDFVVQPKGTGGVLASQPDLPSLGGYNRGANAVDLQTARVINSMVASGTSAVIMGGYANTASGNYSTASGTGNTALGTSSTAFGQGGNAFGNYSFAAGIDISASGIASVGLGYKNTATANYTFVAGNTNKASSESEAVLGMYATTYTAANNNTDRIFAVGNGTGSSSRSNALTILKNANTN